MSFHTIFWYIYLYLLYNCGGGGKHDTKLFFQFVLTGFLFDFVVGNKFFDIDKFENNWVVKIFDQSCDIGDSK